MFIAADFSPSVQGWSDSEPCFLKERLITEPHPACLSAGQNTVLDVVNTSLKGLGAIT